MVAQVHQLLPELIPGGEKKDLSASQEKTLLVMSRADGGMVGRMFAQ